MHEKGEKKQTRNGRFGTQKCEGWRSARNMSGVVMGK